MQCYFIAIVSLAAVPAILFWERRQVIREDLPSLYEIGRGGEAADGILRLRSQFSIQFVSRASRHEAIPCIAEE